MKRILCILIILTTTFLGSCTEASPGKSVDETSEIEMLLEKASATKGEYTGSPITTSAHHMCGAFDEYGTDHVTDIVKARYIETWYSAPSYIHRFEMIENVRGKGDEKTIYVIDKVIGSTSDTPEETFDLKYEKGQGYLLFLMRYIDPCMVSCVYSSAYKGLYIPLTANGNVDIDNAVLCKSSLKEQIKNKEIISAINDNKFIEYFVEITKTNPLQIISSGISESFDAEQIMKVSDHVVKVKIQRQPQKVWATLPFYKTVYVCTVQKSYKGDLTEGIEVTVQLPKYRISEGETYIIAIKNFYEAEMILSSRNSIYGIEMEDNVKAVLAELEK